MENLELIIILLTFVTFLAILADKIKFPFPIMLVLVGVVLGLIPGLPTIELKPEIVFLVFLPPLLYASAWGTSWHEFKANLRPITLAAVGLVLFTTCLVAWAAHYLIPGLGWPEAFVLGAIVSPPDALAATTVTKGLGLHQRIIAILEGESLVNDASGLIAYKYAIVAVATGNFILWEAGIQFFLVAGGGILVGLFVGYIMYLVHKYITCDPIIETVLTFLTSFGSYLLAESIHVSGVLAVVTTGLYLSYRASELFSNLTRIQALAVWETIVFILNGVIFILLGLQLRHVLEQIESYSFNQLLIYGVILSIVVIVVRFIWVFPAAYLPRMLSKKIREREYFSYKSVIIFGWSGMRGVVSMAAALALPFTINGNQPFPSRDLIIFLTFCVIIITLVFQGLTLPLLIKWLKLPKFSVAAEEYEVRLKLASASIVHIEENISYGSVSDNVLAQIKNKYEIKINRLQKTDLAVNENGVHTGQEIFNQFNQLQFQLISVERQIIAQMHKDGSTSEEVLRKIEHELDLEEARLEMERHQD
jgi:CPA1 family monovalent cation:H+ antiporter